MENGALRVEPRVSKTQLGSSEMDEDGQWRSWVRRLASSDEDAVREFWDEYGQRMQRFAASLLDQRFWRREEPEDVVQSVCRTFFRRAGAGEFALATPSSLWCLLCAITAAKTRQKVRFHKRQKRAVGQEQALPTGPDGGEQLAGRMPTPADEVEFADQLDHFLMQLNEDERQVVEGLLQDQQLKEIAATTGIALRTVRRIAQRIRGKCRDIFEESLG